MSKILYAASNISHINNFHLPYIEELRREGHEVFVMARGEGADFNIPFEKRIFSRANSRCQRIIRKIVEREKFDVIILNTSLAAYHIRWALPGRGRPRVVNFVHGYLFPKKPLGAKDLMLLSAEKLLSGRTDRILVMNAEDYLIAERWRLSLRKPVMTLGMGAVCKPARLCRDQIRRQLSCADKLVLSFVGELSKRKNQRLLIEALAEVKKSVPNVVLWLIGEGDEKDALLGLSTKLGFFNSVYFLGRQDNPCDFIRASDIYVSASKTEGMPFNIIEALGTGIPVVASDIKGHRDLLAGGAGVLYPEGDKSALARCVLEVILGGKNMRDRALSVYNKYSFNNVFLSTYKSLTEAAFGE